MYLYLNPLSEYFYCTSIKQKGPSKKKIKQKGTSTQKKNSLKNKKLRKRKILIKKYFFPKFI